MYDTSQFIKNNLKSFHNNYFKDVCTFKYFLSLDVVAEYLELIKSWDRLNKSKPLLGFINLDKEKELSDILVKTKSMWDVLRYGTDDDTVVLCIRLSLIKRWFTNWCMTSSLFQELYRKWVESDYLKDLAPSVDRINNKKPYLKNNIQIMTWFENNKKGRIENKKELS